MSQKDFLKLEIRKPILYGLIFSALIFGAFEYTTTRIEAINKETLMQIKIHNLENEILKNLDEKDRLALTIQSKESEIIDKESENKSLGKEIKQKEKSIEKLKETDKELLQKYSKVFFLNEHYTPRALVDIPTKYLYQKDNPMQIHENVWPFLERLLKRAERDNLNLQIISAYRSFGTQESLKSTYKVIYGAGTANQFSADQGYSEHQLGTTVDFTTPSVGNSFTNFQKTPEYKWLTENAYKYGFTLSYPENNKYYAYEPWHWRFVGEELAEELQDDKKYFYDMEQRDIDEYQENIFES